MFLGSIRNTQYVYFGLSFFKSGCVERAVHSAGGPSPGTKAGEIACKHTKNLSDKQSNAVSSVKTAQSNAIKLLADGGANQEKAIVHTSLPMPSAASKAQSDSSLEASASAALQHVSTARNGSSPTPTSPPS